MVELGVDVVFVVDVVDLLSLDDLIFLQHLQGIVLARPIVFGHFHFPEPAFDKLEVVPLPTVRPMS